MKRWTPDAIATLIASRSNPGYKTGIEATSDGVGFTLHPCRPLVMFLQALGLVEASQDGFRAVSQAADSFLVSLTAHLRGGNPTFMGDWRSGSNEAQSRRLTAMVGGFESHRIDTAPGGNAHPARNTRAGIALVRADVNAIPHFLVIKSHTWTPEGAWTPVMGGEERIDDGDLLNTVTREVCEEMKLRPDDILDTRELARTNDRRISKRLGLDTQYEFGIFSVQLRQASPAVRAFLTDNPRVVIDYNKAVRTHEFTWLTWAELLAQAHLRAEMPTVIQALEQLPFSDISQSIAIPEFEKTVAESRSAPA
jgi:hypothetical protein